MATTAVEATAKRAEYMKAHHDEFVTIGHGRKAHAAYYGWIADEIGRASVVLCIPFTADEIRAAYATDRNLNNLRLSTWDDCHNWIRRMAAHAGFRSWSLSDTVCTLKAAAVAAYCEATE